MRVSARAAGLQSPAWTPSSPSRRHSSRCACPRSSCAAHSTRRSAAFAAWAAALGAYAVAAGALAWGAAAGWNEASFRLYYLGGALLTAPLLGVGSLLLVGRRLARARRPRVRGARDRRRHRRPAPARALGNRRARCAGRARPLAGARARDRRQLCSGRSPSSRLRSRRSGGVPSGTRSSSRESALRLSEARSAGSVSVRSRRSSRPPRSCSTWGSSRLLPVGVPELELLVRLARAPLAEPDAGEEPDDGERDRSFRDRPGTPPCARTASISPG